jgi:hypothetical protein
VFGPQGPVSNLVFFRLVFSQEDKHRDDRYAGISIPRPGAAPTR